MLTWENSTRIWVASHEFNELCTMSHPLEVFTRSEYPSMLGRANVQERNSRFPRMRKFLKKRTRQKKKKSAGGRELPPQWNVVQSSGHCSHWTSLCGKWGGHSGHWHRASMANSSRSSCIMYEHHDPPLRSKGCCLGEMPLVFTTGQFMSLLYTGVYIALLSLFGCVHIGMCTFSSRCSWMCLSIHVDVKGWHQVAFCIILVSERRSLTELTWSSCT